MITKKVTLFKVNGDLVASEPRDLTTDEIEKMKRIVAEEIDVSECDIDVEFVEVPDDLSDIDVTAEGLLDWTDAYFRQIIGVRCTLNEGSDEYLDALNNGNLEEFLTFLKED